MVRRFVRAVLGLQLLVGGIALAGDAAPADCAKGACTCDRGSAPCPLHYARPARRAPVPSFNVNSVGTFIGTVVAVDRVEHGQGLTGVHLRVRAGPETLLVHLGPSSFVDPKMTFAPRDQVVVKGSRSTVEDQPTVVAISVSRSGKSLDLRRDDGTPLFRLE